MKTFKRDNVLIALMMAIETRAKFEREQLQYTSDSALLAGWRELYNAVQSNEDLQIID